MSTVGEAVPDTGRRLLRQMTGRFHARRDKSVAPIVALNDNYCHADVVRFDTDEPVPQVCSSASVKRLLQQGHWPSNPLTNAKKAEG